MLFFFKQKTAYEILSRDWSSDVCSSDLLGRTVVSKGGNCCNTASESGGDLRGQQFAETSPTNYLSKGLAITPPDLER